jgi:hypothetical protein
VLVGLGHVLLAQDEIEAAQAVQFLAATSTLRTEMNIPVRPFDQVIINNALATAESLLGGDAFAAAWPADGDLPLEAVVNRVLNLDDAPAAS